MPSATSQMCCRRGICGCPAEACASGVCGCGSSSCDADSCICLSAGLILCKLCSAVAASVALSAAGSTLRAAAPLSVSAATKRGPCAGERDRVGPTARGGVGGLSQRLAALPFPPRFGGRRRGKGVGERLLPVEAWLLLGAHPGCAGGGGGGGGVGGVQPSPCLGGILRPSGSRTQKRQCGSAAQHHCDRLVCN